MSTLPAVGAVWWLEEAMAGDPGHACPPLAGTVRTDVCVVGGGFAGLWTAIELRERSPDVKVVLLEQYGCGFGASGRNGGWATGWHDELDALVARFGEQEAARLAGRSAWAIDRVESFAAQHGIDARFRRAGAVKMATRPGQEEAWDSPLEACRRLGRESMLRIVDGEDVRRSAGTPLALKGLCQTDAAAVQPASLARGLRRVALELGVRIHEGSPMAGLDRGRTPVVRTPAGRVECERVVLALGAWSGAVRELRRATVPIGSHIVATEPLGAGVAGLEWSRGGLLGDTRLMVHYAQVSTDGRIVFGRGGGALGPAGRVIGAHLRDDRAIRSIAADFRRWFPTLAGARLTHAWGGAVDRAPGHFPFTGTLGDHGELLYGCGFSGNGVAPSAYIGSVLARQALRVVDEDTSSPLTAGPPAYLPPEPLRTVGGAVVRRAVELSERAEERGRPSIPRGILRRLVATTVPVALDPRARARENRRAP